MHMQPLYKDHEIIGGEVSEKLFNDGICLPSGTAMTDDDMKRIISVKKTDEPFSVSPAQKEHLEKRLQNSFGMWDYNEGGRATFTMLPGATKKQFKKQ